MNLTQLRLATAADTDTIVALVNRAYRPQHGAVGWTHETALISGPRIDAAQLGSTLQQPDSHILLAQAGEQLLGCVNVARDGDCAYIGMLAVEPARQTAGLGKQLLRAAEDFAEQRFGIRHYRMIVLSSRSELIAFYLRRGYQRTGQVMDYPLGAGVGLPKQAGLCIEVLEKAPASAAGQPRPPIRHP